MGKLSANQQKIVGSNCSSANVHNNRRKEVQVYTPSADKGKKVKGAIAAAYPEYKFYMAEDRGLNQTGNWLFGFLTLGVGNAIQAASQTWKNFTVECDSQDNAKALVKEIGDCIGEYSKDDDTPLSGNGGTGNGGNQPDPDEPQKEKTDWTTYIIIGAAALALILLLWPKRKK